MMTELEAVAMATAYALRNAEGWKQEQADKASKYLQDKFAKGEIDAETFAKAIARCTANVSQRRQALERMGFIVTKETDSAEKREIESAMKRLDALADQLEAKRNAEALQTPKK